MKIKRIITLLLLLSPVSLLANNKGKNIADRIDESFAPLVDFLNEFLMWDPFAATGLELSAPVPFIVVWLVAGATFFTIYMGFVNFSGFKHAIDLVRGRFDDPNDEGDVSHFKALTTALSATVGLGNIAGVAIAISVGGPGATFWMIVAGLLGMTSKFTECTLAVKYRDRGKDGQINGGPMYYLKKGLARRNMKMFGQVLAILFATMIVIGSFGLGNMFQSNQAFEQFKNVFPSTTDQGFWFGLILAILVGFVIVGGIKSISRVTSKIVPFMAVFYVLFALIVIFLNAGMIGDAFAMIFNGAFSPDGIKGGFLGVLIMGFRRAAFSNEAGIGSAPIAHSAAKTKHPVSEGFVALLEPFIDTVVICTITALVIITTGMYAGAEGISGAELTSRAFTSEISGFKYFLMLAIFLFAFSTLISWSYYGVKGFDFLFGRISQKILGKRIYASRVYQLVFLLFVIVGSSTTISNVMEFSDMLILAMAFPNILGLIIMSGEVRKDLKVYFKKISNGEIKRFK
jgi:alanine or glycine:cation symporter, AGCS family